MASNLTLRVLLLTTLAILAGLVLGITTVYTDSTNNIGHMWEHWESGQMVFGPVTLIIVLGVVIGLILILSRKSNMNGSE